MTCSTCGLPLSARHGGWVVLSSGELLCLGCYYKRFAK